MKSYNCPSCKKDWPENYCPECARSIEPEQRHSTSAQADSTVSQKPLEHEYTQNGFCKHCGWERSWIEKNQRGCLGAQERVERVEAQKQVEQESKSAEQKPASAPASQPSGSSGLPFGIIAAAAAGWFLMGHKNQLGENGGFIIIIGAVVLGLLSASMLSKK
jgi:hypothetical protein